MEELALCLRQGQSLEQGGSDEARGVLPVHASLMRRLRRKRGVEMLIGRGVESGCFRLRFCLSRRFVTLTFPPSSPDERVEKKRLCLPANFV
jgi:hypothetical protein